MIDTNKEQHRLAVAKRYLKLDFNSEQKLDAIARLASHITQTPVNHLDEKICSVAKMTRNVEA